jgi:hypothetical protein
MPSHKDVGFCSVEVYPPGPLQLYVYVPEPPVTLAVMLPLQEPQGVDVGVKVAANVVLTNTVVVDVCIHPFISVTINVYVWVVGGQETGFQI